MVISKEVLEKWEEYKKEVEERSLKQVEEKIEEYNEKVSNMSWWTQPSYIRRLCDLVDIKYFNTEKPTIEGFLTWLNNQE